MQIECPSCHARASLPESKLGAKVRCSECGRVYVARERGSAASAGGGKSAASARTRQFLLIGGVALVTAIGIALASKRGEQAPAPAAITRAVAAETPRAPAESDGFDAPSVQAVVELVRAAAEGDLDRVRAGLSARAIHARLENANAKDAAGTSASFDALDFEARNMLLEQAALELASGGGAQLTVGLTPYDGRVLESSAESAHVQVDSSVAGTNGEKRSARWRLVREPSGPAGRWKAWSWELYLSPEDLAARERTEKQRAFQQVTLSDGSKVLEREPEPLSHLADTPPELAQRIDALYARMIDLRLTKEASAAQSELIAIGKPAIPILLTGLYEIPLGDEDQVRQVTLIVRALKEMTGQDFGYRPQVAEGSGVGTTSERRASAIKQYFAWWYRNHEKFSAPEKDSSQFDKLNPLTEKEKAWLERNKDQK
jgi:predicted Zn finger-like uncharacterized protein